MVGYAAHVNPLVSDDRMGAACDAQGCTSTVSNELNASDVVCADLAVSNH